MNMRQNKRTTSDSDVLIVRADASTAMGTGHVMRSLALAQAWRQHRGRVVFVSAELAESVKRRLKAEGMRVVRVEDDRRRAAHTIQWARQLGANHVVLDGYHFSSEYQAAIQGAGLRLMVIDDFGEAGPYHADWILNQNYSASKNLYPCCAPGAGLLLGPKFALLRHEFLQKRRPTRRVPRIARRVLVTLGGSDPDNTTLRIIQAFQSVCVESLEIIVVVGGANPHLESLDRATRMSNGNIVVRVDVADMPSLMGWADIAVASASTTSWELAFLGVPSLLVALAENQRIPSASAEEVGVALTLGWHSDLDSKEMAARIQDLILDQKLRSSLAHRGMELLDGRGAERALAALTSVAPRHGLPRR
jgi:UDP-2,4-diacetamido-2,4,6-trideoxy-beta-L-altropyranose hydrolase